MVETGGDRPRGPLARLRAARRNAAVFVAPESPRMKGVTLAALVVVTGVISTLTTVTGVGAAPPLALAVPVVLGGFLLERPALRWLLVVVTGALVAEIVDQGWDRVRPGSAVVLAVIAVIAVELARDRERLGVTVGRGEAMLIELRDQLRRQGELPHLPRGWYADVAQRSAGASSFGGDFIVSAMADDGKRLELAVVDVSGKGLDAGTRALLLSGALGGLLGSIAPERFLTAANDYAVRQEWEEGFATALHVAIDLQTGDYRLSSAGHPPAVHYAGGSGRWNMVELEGLVLGVAADATFGVSEGQLLPYDALLLYTDGLVEVPGRDLSVGIDKLLGSAEAMIPRGFAGGAQLMVDTVAPEAADDRAVVLLWRA